MYRFSLHILVSIAAIPASACLEADVSPAFSRKINSWEESSGVHCQSASTPWKRHQLPTPGLAGLAFVLVALAVGIAVMKCYMSLKGYSPDQKHNFRGRNLSIQDISTCSSDEDDVDADDDDDDDDKDKKKEEEPLERQLMQMQEEEKKIERKNITTIALTVVAVLCLLALIALIIMLILNNREPTYHTPASTTHPSTTYHPSTTHPSTTHPSTTHPSTTHPSTTHPLTTLTTLTTPLTTLTTLLTTRKTTPLLTTRKTTPLLTTTTPLTTRKTRRRKTKTTPKHWDDIDAMEQAEKDLNDLNKWLKTKLGTSSEKRRRAREKLRDLLDGFPDGYKGILKDLEEPSGDGPPDVGLSAPRVHSKNFQNMQRCEWHGVATHFQY